MTSEEEIIEWLSKYIDHDIDDNTYENMIDSLLEMFSEHAAEAIKAHEKKRWEECYRKASERN